MAIIAILDYIPLDHPRRQECINAELDIINVLIRFHDGETGLWYQVVDKGDRKDNWLETSCSSLFTCAIAKAIKKVCCTNHLSGMFTLHGMGAFLLMCSEYYDTCRQLGL